MPHTPSRTLAMITLSIAIGLAVLSAKLSALARAGHSLPPEGDPD